MREDLLVVLYAAIDDADTRSADGASARRTQAAISVRRGSITH